MRIVWRDELLGIVTSKWHKKPLPQIANEIGIGKTTLYRHIKRLGLTPPAIDTSVASSASAKRRAYRRRQWRIEEDEYIIKYYHTKSPKAIARKLKRSEASIFHRAHRIGATYEPERHLLRRDEVALMLGIPVVNLVKRYAEDAAFPIPIVRKGRYIQIDEFEFREWLKAGHILAFDRAKIARELWRMYDEWDARTISSADVYRECQPIGEALRGDGHQLQLITIKPINQHIYLRDEIFEYAYRYGNRIVPWSSPRFLAIKAAWDTEFILKADVIAHVGAGFFSRKVAPHLTTTNKFYAKRIDVCAALQAHGKHDLARALREVPISWQEMMADYERKNHASTTQ